MTTAIKKAWQRPLNSRHRRALLALRPPEGAPCQRISASIVRRAIGKYATQTILSLIARGFMSETVIPGDTGYQLTADGLAAACADRELASRDRARGFEFCEHDQIVGDCAFCLDDEANP